MITYAQEILVPGLQEIDMPWGWQYLGTHRHVVLPSCAVAKIRQVFPSESEDYTGHNIHQPHHNIFTYIIVLHVCSYTMLMFVMRE